MSKNALISSQNVDLFLMDLQTDFSKPKTVIKYMSPDQIDKFMSWISERVDLQSFFQSSNEYKARQVNLFFKLNPGEAQLSLF